MHLEILEPTQSELTLICPTVDSLVIGGTGAAYPYGKLSSCTRLF